MKKLLSMLMIATFLSCGDENVKDKEVRSSLTEEVWICYNLNSSSHGKECTAECMERGNPYTFCWFREEEPREKEK